MNCETCTYRFECASADVLPESVDCAAQAEIIDLAEYRRMKGLDEDKLFGEIDEFLKSVCWWIIGGGVVLVAWNLLRRWLVGCVNP